MAYSLKNLVNSIRTCNSAFHLSNRCYSSAKIEKALILGVHTKEGCDHYMLSKRAEEINLESGGKLNHLLNIGPPLELGSSRILWDLTPDYPAVAAVGAGPNDIGYDEIEEINVRDENIRIACGAGVNSLRSLNPAAIEVDPMSSARAAAEGSFLAAYVYQRFKKDKSRKHVPKIMMFSEGSDDAVNKEWMVGEINANCQNWARDLMETPANWLTPTIFSMEAAKFLRPLGIEVIARDEKWIEEQKMYSFLSVSRGSAEPPVMLELHYKGSEEGAPIVLVGKGVTFDTGGISLKPCARLADMKGDMGGGAAVCAALRAAALMKLNINLIGLIPLTENMPGGRATKPGDIVTARNGLTILVDNTDAEGRLILADALSYANDFKPEVTIDLATLTGAMSVTLGDTASGVFSTSRELVEQLKEAASVTGDRLWRMPMYKRFAKTMKDYALVDLHNTGRMELGGSCKAAAFLQQFAPACGRWAHLDIASVMKERGDQTYLSEGMTGRPSRTLIQYLINLSCK